MEDILTSRLILRPMPDRFLEACLRDELAAAEAVLGMTLSPEWLAEKSFMELRLNDLRNKPDYRSWSPRAIGFRESGLMIGHIGFHSCPDADYLKEFVRRGVEFGYTIFPDHRRKGCALEAIQGLLRWASRERNVDTFVISVAPSNVASTSLAKKIGFVKIGEHIDESDGLEDVYVLRGDELQRFSGDASVTLC